MMLAKMTTTPSLNVVSEAAKSASPALGYASANVLPLFEGTIMIRLGGKLDRTTVFPFLTI